MKLAGSGAPFVERKLRLEGDAVEYPCTLALLAPPLIVIRYVFDARDGPFDTPVPLPPGTVSLGYFWLDRPYNAYRMRSPSGDILAHRFDAVTDIVFADGVVSYRDLVLDWWLIPGRPLVEEDRDELEAAEALGRLSRADIASVHDAEARLTGGIDGIVAELANIEAGLL